MMPFPDIGMPVQPRDHAGDPGLLFIGVEIGQVQGQGFLAWTWDTGGAPYLLLDYTGAPTPGFGVTYQKHLMGL